MKNIMDSGWEIYPAGGVTGEAFYACHNNEQLFIKRNSSPFLAVLSAEGIVPKLVWTKRLESGDTITAQRWIAGRKLDPIDMSSDRVAKLLKKIHSSKPLLTMLRRLGKSPVNPEHLITDLQYELPDYIKKNNGVMKAFKYLKECLPHVQQNNWSVCHGDVNHNNWLLTEENELYLIDWEGAVIGDPAMDLGPLLYWYVADDDWENWLSIYGCTLNTNLARRMKWYVLYQTLASIKLYSEKGYTEESSYWLQYIETIL